MLGYDAMNINYTSYATEAFTNIQSINDDVQIGINNFYDHLKERGSREYINHYYVDDIKTDILSYIELLDDIMITYITHMKMCYETESYKNFNFPLN